MNRSPTIFERIQMDLQHDIWNSRIKFWGTLVLIILADIAIWWYWLS